jgi:hypothetical protein
MVEFGLDPDDNSLDPTTPVGIGNLAAKAVIERQTWRWINEDGKLSHGEAKRYADYTEYKPLIPPTSSQTSLAGNQNILQMERREVCTACLTPHWGKVKPLGLNSGDQFRPGPPPA